MTGLQVKDGESETSSRKITSRREVRFGAGGSLASPLPFLRSREQTTGESLPLATAAS